MGLPGFHKKKPADVSKRGVWLRTLKGRASLQPAKERSLYYSTNGQNISKGALDKGLKKAYPFFKR